MTTFNPTNEQLSSLSPKELKYWRMLKAQAGIPYLKGKPGTAKTAMIESMAEKLGMQYLDLRLTLIDETEVGQMPIVDKKDASFRFAVPEWAKLANEKPTLIAVEEFNRASIAHRNAMMQIFNERRIGQSFKFNKDVFFMATGNLGESDGTEVDELDSAQKTRMIPIKHDLNLKEWTQAYANDNVIPEIIEFLEAYPQYFYEEEVMKKIANGDSTQETYGNPRTWDFLSKYISANYGDASNPLVTDSTEWLDDVKSIAHYYIGSCSVKFISYISQRKVFRIQDVINAKSKKAITSLVNKMDRPTQSEMLIKLSKGYKFKDFNQKQTDNLMHFFEKLDQDEVAGYFNENIWIEFNKDELQEMIDTYPYFHKLCRAAWSIDN